MFGQAGVLSALQSWVPDVTHHCHWHYFHKSTAQVHQYWQVIPDLDYKYVYASQLLNIKLSLQQPVLWLM